MRLPLQAASPTLPYINAKLSRSSFSFLVQETCWAFDLVAQHLATHLLSGWLLGRFISQPRKTHRQVGLCILWYLQ
eukprot:c30093_g1_i1 orf=132-359(+)